MLRAFQSMKSGMMACLCLCLLAAPARAEVVVNESIPITISVFVPCAAGGAGETVELSGDLHTLIAFTLDNAGGGHSKTHFQPQGISGVGLTTGLKYQATGVTQETFNFKVGIQDTFVNNFKIIGQGPNNNFLVHENIHITVNANGTVTATVDNFSVECR